MPLRPSTLSARTPFMVAGSYLLPAILLLTAACNSDVAAPAPVARKDTASPASPANPTTPAPAASARACDVRLTAGVDAPSVEVHEGKTYCVRDLEFTRMTTLAAAHASLGGGCREEVLDGETRLACKGVELSFGGPVLILLAIRTTNS